MALVLWCSTARAGSWTFSWHCNSGIESGCAAHQLGASGTEGPFDSESACESARTQMAFRINSPGNAGSTNACVDSSSGGGTSSGTTSSGPVRAAHLTRLFLGVTGGPGYSADYASGTAETGSQQVGGQFELVFGRDVFGLALFFDLARDSGTSPDMATPVEPMWLFDYGLGLASSPFAIVKRARLEIRPDIGIYGMLQHRLGCGERCDSDGPLGTGQPAEPAEGFLWRTRVGVDVFWGARHNRGISLDALFQFGHLGDSSDPDSLAVLTPPRVLLRLAWIPYRDPPP
jgi:hypothetical protein